MSDEFKQQAVALMKQCLTESRTLQALLTGDLNRERLRRVALNQYAEIRAFIDFKIPERMRLCPHEATSAKEYFAYLYREEQGGFVPGSDHASLFHSALEQLGISREEAELHYQKHLRRYAYMMFIQPSVEALVRELAISFSWEAYMATVGKETIAAVQSHYGLSDVSYFQEHSEVDPGHMEQALDILARWATTERLRSIALQAIRETLVDDLYLDW